MGGYKTTYCCWCIFIYFVLHSDELIKFKQPFLASHLFSRLFLYKLIYQSGNFFVILYSFCCNIPRYRYSLHYKNILLNVFTTTTSHFPCFIQIIVDHFYYKTNTHTRICFSCCLSFVRILLLNNWMFWVDFSQNCFEIHFLRMTFL